VSATGEGGCATWGRASSSIAVRARNSNKSHLNNGTCTWLGSSKAESGYNSIEMDVCCNHYSHVENLVTCAADVEKPRCPSLRNPSRVDGSAHEI